MTRRYKQVFIGGPRHGQINRDVVPPGAPLIRVAELAGVRSLADMPPEEIGIKTHDYYRRDLALFSDEFWLTFWVHDDLQRAGRADDAIVEFLLFPLEI